MNNFQRIDKNSPVTHVGGNKVMKESSNASDVALVVDDSPETLALLNDALDQAGFTVLVALDGAQALSVAARMAPDIVLLDAIMPNIDGFETCRRLKMLKAVEHVPVIFMTGLSDTEHIVMGLEAGGVDYVTKPINPYELIARMRVHLNNARLTMSARSALDATRQFLFAVDGDGRIKWATPQASTLFERAGATKPWLAENLPTALKPWVKSAPDRDRMLLLNELADKLYASYLGKAGNDEHLLRLVDGKSQSQTEPLRTQFGVTGREAEVLLWIANGKTNREIGTILSMSPRTVNKHLEQIFRKLSVENRTSAAAMALKAMSGN